MSWNLLWFGGRWLNGKGWVGIPPGPINIGTALAFGGKCGINPLVACVWGDGRLELCGNCEGKLLLLLWLSWFGVLSRK